MCAFLWKLQHMGTFVARAEKSYEVLGDFFSQPKQSVKQHLKGGAMSFCTISLSGSVGHGRVVGCGISTTI